MIIPWETLDKNTLNNVIESVLLREDLDNVLEKETLTQRVLYVISLLQKGKVVIVWSELHETVNIIDKDKFNSQMTDSY